MKSLNKVIGNYSENLAENYLKVHHYTILDKNFRNRFGEIDIICRKKNLLIFVEIKSRYTSSYGFPSESVTCYKKNKIILLSKYYIYLKKFNNVNIRYDVIEVYLNHNNDSYNIKHIKDAFRCY